MKKDSIHVYFKLILVSNKVMHVIGNCKARGEARAFDANEIEKVVKALFFFLLYDKVFERFSWTGQFWSVHFDTCQFVFGKDVV